MFFCFSSSQWDLLDLPQLNPVLCGGVFPLKVKMAPPLKRHTDSVPLFFSQCICNKKCPLFIHVFKTKVSQTTKQETGVWELTQMC